MNCQIPPSHDPASGRNGVAVVLGTRPEIIKLAPVIHALGPEARVFDTGQHYDADMSRVFWDSFGLPEPELVLDVGNLPRALQVSTALARLDAVFAERPPHTVIVQGDTNATLAGGLAANARGVRLIHVEAGLRSYDRAMPEEHNRVVVSQLADVLCAPTPESAANLRESGIPDSRIHITGNTVVEALNRQLPDAATRRRILRDHELAHDGYVLATIHRPENTDEPTVLAAILDELRAIHAPVVFPLHPRTRARIEEFGLTDALADLRVTAPLPPDVFLALAAEAAALVSDSGGVQEECTVIKKPLVVVRRSTERPEALEDFAVLATPGPDVSNTVGTWLRDLTAVHRRLSATPSPYGDGTASARIANLARRP